MKRLFYIFIALVAVLGAFSCTEQETDIPVAKISFSESIESDFENVTISCAVDGNVSAEKLVVAYSKDKATTDAKTVSCEKKGDTFTLTISGLEIQTTYYYRYTVENKASTFVDDKIREFRTLDYVAPQVTTVGATEVSGTKATLQGTINFACGKDILEKGFKIGKDQNNLEAQTIEAEEFRLKVEDLEFETIYYYQAYAKSEIGTGYGEVKEFKTCNAVSFKEVSVKDILATSASFIGGVQDSGGIDIERQGFYYSITDGEGTFVESNGEASVTGLLSATTYKVWYYAKTFEGEFQSDKIEFTTADGCVAFGDLIASAITATSFTVTSSISGDGGSAITQRGFAYGTSALPTIEGNIIKVSGTSGQMSGSITELTNNTLYYIRAYAVNEVGVSYGSQITVSTMSGIAKVGGTEISDIMAESATFVSSIISSNGVEITACGFCYGLAKSPTISDNRVNVSEQNGQLAKTVAINKSTTYYVRAFATTQFGTSYGEEASFTSKSGVVSFSYLTVSNILSESVLTSVIIDDDGGSTITERGFCYSTNEQPTTSNNRVSVNSSESSITGTLSSLSRSTKYYVRAYAKNATGTYYSLQESFTTPSGMASLGTIVASNVENVSASFSCEVSSDGGASITSRGFCYSKSPMPTVNSSKKTVDGTLGTMTSIIEGLEPGTTYYVRAYATTKYGTNYSNEIQITTKLGLPTMDTVTVSDIEPTSVTLSSGIAVAGDGYILEKGYCYSTQSSPTKDDAIAYVNNSWTLELTGLRQNTQYYVCSFVTTQYGTAYSQVESFKTTYYPVVFAGITTTKVLFHQARIDCTIDSFGGNSVIRQGFCYGVSSGVSINDNLFVVSEGTSMRFAADDLEPETTYYVKGFVENAIGVFYTNEVSFTTLSAPPQGAVHGLFSISADKKAYFASGNTIVHEAKDSIWYYDAYNNHVLQNIYHKLSILDEQYSYLNVVWRHGIDDTVYYSDSTFPADVCYWDHENYGKGRYEKMQNKDIFISARHVDGISNDYNWYMPTDEEWTYVLNERQNCNLLKISVYINGEPGLLLLPDEFELPYGAVMPTNNSSLSNSEWVLFERAGAVFLPSIKYQSFSYGYYDYSTQQSYSFYSWVEPVANSPEWKVVKVNAKYYGSGNPSLGALRLILYNEN